jgi:hypothetical protein
MRMELVAIGWILMVIGALVPAFLSLPPSLHHHRIQ